MRLKLDQIENRLQALFEGSIYWLQIGDQKHQLSNQIVNALKEDLSQFEVSQSPLNPGSDGERDTGYEFRSLSIVIELNPLDYQDWTNLQEFEHFLSQAISSALRESASNFRYPPFVRLQSNAQLPPQSLRIFTTQNEIDSGHTVSLSTIMKLEGEKKSPARPKAYLLLADEQVFNLEKTVVDIGRLNENDLIFQDKRVSRRHAQLREVQTRHIIFDLNSTGGTFINNQRITQHVLKSGDLISLAGLQMIYIQEDVKEDTKRIDTD